MAKRAKSRPRRSRRLPPVPVGVLIGASAELMRLDRQMLADGYRRAGAARPLLSASGATLTVRVVWRRREAGLCATFTQVVKLPVGRV